MGKLKYIISLLGGLLIINSCTVNHSSELEICGNYAIEDEINYASSVSFYTIKEVSVIGNCLKITISASGCSGDRWQANLYFSEQISETSYIQRFSNLILETNEACLAVFEKTFVFDLSNMRPNNNSFILNLNGWNTQIIIN